MEKKVYDLENRRAEKRYMYGLIQQRKQGVSNSPFTFKISECVKCSPLTWTKNEGCEKVCRFVVSGFFLEILCSPLCRNGKIPQLQFFLPNYYLNKCPATTSESLILFFAKSKTKPKLIDLSDTILFIESSLSSILCLYVFYMLM